MERQDFKPSWRQTRIGITVRVTILLGPTRQGRLKYAGPMVGLGGQSNAAPDQFSCCNRGPLSLISRHCRPPQLRGGNRVNGSALSFLRPIVPNDSRSSSPAHFCIPPPLVSPQAVVALVAAYRLPFKEVHLPSRDARARVGRLAVHCT